MNAEGDDVSDNGLHDEALQRDGIERVFVAVVEFQVVVENQAALHVGRPRINKIVIEFGIQEIKKITLQF